MNLDCAYLLEYCKDKGDLHLRLEDDAPFVENWIPRMHDFLEQLYNTADWSMASIYHGTLWNEEKGTINWSHMPGSFGLLWKSSDLERVAHYMFDNADQFPTDWAFGNYVESRKPLRFIRHPEMLLEHIGLVSSKVKGPDFEDPATWNKCDIRRQQLLIQQWEYQQQQHQHNHYMVQPHDINSVEQERQKAQMQKEIEEMQARQDAQEKQQLDLKLQKQQEQKLLKEAAVKELLEQQAKEQHQVLQQHQQPLT